MITLAGYEDLNLINHSENSLTYRARRVSDRQPVILKFLNQDYPTSEQIRRYKQEYYLTCQLDSPRIVKAYSLEPWQRSYAIVLEDFGGRSLGELLQQREQFSLSEFLELAIAITESLGEIHAQHIIHKDINPANIVFNPETKELKIIDFGIATQLSRENPNLKNPQVIEGILPYISPEQTGRMNRNLDYRTDFYSLGVTFYQMLTGRLPFDSNDPMELVHCHIAKMPEGLGNRDSGTANREEIPPIIAEMVLKLMAKNAEDRYQNAYGLKADLVECRRQLEETGNIGKFLLGQHDICDRFSIPQKLYGRKTEIQTLLDAFERVAATGKVELMMVAGYSGIGKSSLVQELYKPITARRGYFMAGKFDQFQRNIPYSAIIGAFEELIGQILTEDEARLQIWREKLLQALGTNGQIIIDVIPEVELIIGQQPTVADLGSNEAQNRFHLVFGNFIRAFCDLEHPITLFIDDLQWADLATLQLIERLLIEGNTEYLLLLGAYRDNEVDASHPLAISLAKIQQNQRKINQINLAPLPTEEVAWLIGDTLGQHPDQVKNLSRSIWQKTEGNPFFVNEFLQALYDEELLTFDREQRIWQWDLAAIAARGFTDNVVELMVEKLQKLPRSSQELLSLAACWGAEFDLTLLTWIVEKSATEIFAELKITLDRGFILPTSELDENLLIQSYKFGHDRIQQAAYALIPDAEKPATHYRIAQVLWQQLGSKAKTDRIFELVGQFNYGIQLVTEEKDRDKLAQLNLIACRKARDATAYQAAREYASVGLAWLGENGWERQYQTTLELYELTVELASLCGDVESMERFVEIVVSQAESVLDRVNVYYSKIVSNVSRNKPTEAIEIAKQLLAELGCTFPDIPTAADTQQAIAQIVELIGDREIQDLVNLPTMTDREKIAIVQITSSILPAACVSGSPLLLLLAALSVKLSIQYGNTLASASGYAWYGFVICTLLNDIDRGVEFGKLAIRFTANKPEAKAFRAEALDLGGWAILHRKFYLETTLSVLQEAYAVGMEVGNLLYAGYAASNICVNSFFCGLSLVSLEEEVRFYYQRFVHLNPTMANYCQLCWHCVVKLLGWQDNASSLDDEAVPESELLPQLLAVHDIYGVFLVHLYQLIIYYLFGDIELAQQHAIETRNYLVAGQGMCGAPAFYFYDSLVILAALKPDSEGISAGIERLEANQAKWQQDWVSYAPMNNQHKMDLVAAEKCRVLGKKAEAIELYNRAISGAQANKYIQEEALANELAAKFFLDWGQEKLARVYMQDAHYCYSRWGATAKVKHLEANYPQLCQTSQFRGSQGSSYSNSDRGSNSNLRSSGSSSNLDINTLMKASQAIAGEIVIGELLTKLINILVENTGARSGYLILETEGELLIEAAASADGAIAVLQSMSLESVKPDGSSPLLCPAIANYVARTYESVVLHDAEHEGNFTTQSYIQNFQVKSVLCVPLLNQGQLRGVVYLENNLTAGAFTEERVEMVKLLSGQAAIAITNAKLYTEVKQSEQRLIQFLEAIPMGVSVHNGTGQLHYANQTAQQLLGMNIAPKAKKEQLAQAFQVYRAGTEDLYPNEQLPVVRSLAGETVKVDDLELHHPDKILPLEVSSTPIFDETGKVVYGMVVFQDITERKQAEKILIDYNQSLETQLALSRENSQLYEASKRFVPSQFLSLLEKQSIVDVQLGDRVEREMTILFADIRDFTTMSEQMNPAENFAFINEYLGYMEPQIKKYGGFIDKYIGDAIMALFPKSADDAVSGAIAMLEALKTYNHIREENNLTPVRIGIGVHTGSLMLGTVGGLERIDVTTIGDAVNLCSRVEGLTKTYGASLLITHQTLARLNNPLEYDLRFVEQVKAKGKEKAVGLFEVFSVDPPELRLAKSTTREKFEMAVMLYHWGSFSQAARLFEECLEYYQGDRAARSYLDRCLLNIS